MSATKIVWFSIQQALNCEQFSSDATIHPHKLSTLSNCGTKGVPSCADGVINKGDMTKKGKLCVTFRGQGPRGNFNIRYKRPGRRQIITGQARSCAVFMSGAETCKGEQEHLF